MEPSDPLAPRRAAAHALVAILTTKAPLDAAWGTACARGELDARGKAFSRSILATTLRRLGRIDAILDTWITRPLPDTAPFTRALLRTATAQLLFQRTPDYAVVDATVTLAEADPASRRYKGLINAVLRKVAKAGPAQAEELGPAGDWPAWLMQAWAAHYGPERAAAIGAASGQEAALDLTVKADAEEWARRLGGEVLPTGSVRLARAGDVTALDGFDEGAWWVQDAAAALPAQLLAAKPGERVLDLCAAPGGKTMQLASTGARVTALDISASRMKALRSNLARTRLQAEVVVADARTYAPTELFDALLVDAPCSATGTLRRNPDVAWTKSPSDVASLAGVQLEVLRAASRLLKPGGRLVFCTCSLQGEEGAPAFLAALGEADLRLEADPIAPDALRGLDTAVCEQGFVRTAPDMWQDIGGLDGFFMARARKC